MIWFAKLIVHLLCLRSNYVDYTNVYTTTVTLKKKHDELIHKHEEIKLVVDFRRINGN